MAKPGQTEGASAESRLVDASMLTRLLVVAWDPAYMKYNGLALHSTDLFLGVYEGADICVLRDDPWPAQVLPVDSPHGMDQRCLCLGRAHDVWRLGLQD